MEDQTTDLAAQAEVPEVVRTAPERIWLQVSDDRDHLDKPFPASTHGDEVTWCQDRVLDCEVPYIRADLATPTAQASSAATAAPTKAGVPAGFALVPIEPTAAMLDAMRNAPIPAVMLDSHSANARMVASAQYRAALAATLPETATAAQEAPGLTADAQYRLRYALGDHDSKLTGPQLTRRASQLSQKAAKWDEWHDAQGRIEDEMPEGWAFVIQCSPGDWDLYLTDHHGERVPYDRDCETLAQQMSSAVDAARAILAAARPAEQQQGVTAPESN